MKISETLLLLPMGISHYMNTDTFMNEYSYYYDESEVSMIGKIVNEHLLNILHFQNKMLVPGHLCFPFSSSLWKK